MVNKLKIMTTATTMTVRKMMMVKEIRCVAGKKVSGHASFAMKICQVFWDQWQCGARHSFHAGSNIFPLLMTSGNLIIQSMSK